MDRRGDGAFYFLANVRIWMGCFFSHHDLYSSTMSTNIIMNVDFDSFTLHFKTWRSVGDKRDLLSQSDKR